jgi:hypothetical protein
LTILQSILKPFSIATLLSFGHDHVSDSKFPFSMESPMVEELVSLVGGIGVDDQDQDASTERSGGETSP